jgi:hypothetical protein
LGAVLLLAGCPDAEVAAPVDLPVGPGAPLPTPGGQTGGGFTQPPPVRDRQSNPEPSSTLGGGRLRVTVKQAVTGVAIAGARVGAVGPGLGIGVTDAAGTLELGPLPLGRYDLRVDAPGKLAITRTLDLEIARAAATQDVELVIAPRTLTGRIRDAQGNPVVGARIALGDAWTGSGSDGAYTLAAPAAGEAEVRKTGFGAARTGGGEVTLQPELTRISFENGPFGAAAALAFSRLRGALAAAGWTVADGDLTAQVRVWAAPAAISPDQAKAAAAFVAGGGKLVVLGDWGGAARYSPDAVNRLLLPLGVAITPDLARNPANAVAERFLASLAPAWPKPAGVAAVEVDGAATVQAAMPATPILNLPATALRVQTTADPPALAVARQVATGLAVALGDTSFWLDTDIGRHDNLSFAKSVMLW